MRHILMTEGSHLVAACLTPASTCLCVCLSKDPLSVKSTSPLTPHTLVCFESIRAEEIGCQRKCNLETPPFSLPPFLVVSLLQFLFSI